MTRTPTGSRADGDDEMEFSFTQLTPGVSTINDLQEEMGKKDGEASVNNKKFTALYTAQTSLDFKGNKDTSGESEPDEMYQDLPHRDASIR